MNGLGVADLHLFITTYVEQLSARQWPQQTTSAAANKHRRIVSLSLVRRLLRPKFPNYYYSIWVEKLQFWGFCVSPGSAEILVR